MLKWICLSALICLTGLLTGKEKVVLVTGEWEPYSSEKIIGKGAFTEIVTAVFEEMKIECEIRFYPWKRAEMMVADGSVAAAFPYVINEERYENFIFTDAVMNSTGRFFYYRPANRVNVQSWNSYNDLKIWKIGSVLGYWYEKDFKSAGITADYVSSDELNFKKLQAGRVDLIPADELVGRAIIKNIFPAEEKNFAVLTKPLNTSTLHLMISRKYPHAQIMAADFNQPLKKIKSNGKHQSIIAKYGILE